MEDKQIEHCPPDTHQGLQKHLYFIILKHLDNRISPQRRKIGPIWPITSVDPERIPKAETFKVELRGGDCGRYYCHGRRS
jgi:hypothetical protein